MGKLAQKLSGQSQSQIQCLKKGGMVHDDAKQDKALIAKELKARGLKCGGKVKK